MAKARMVFLLCSTPMAHLLEWNNFRFPSFYSFHFLFDNLMCSIQSHLFSIWICTIQHLSWCLVYSREPRMTRSGWVHAFAVCNRNGLLYIGTWPSSDLRIGICYQPASVFAKVKPKDQGMSPPTFSLKALCVPKQQKEGAARPGSLFFFLTPWEPNTLGSLGPQNP